MKILALIIASFAASLALAAPALARPSALVLTGPHVHAGNVGLRAWAAEAAANVPLPRANVLVNYGDPATYDNNYGDPLPPWSLVVSLPRVGRGGWTAMAVQGDFVHELGHVFDQFNMTPALRRTFMSEAGVPATCTRWWRDCKTVRWTVNDHYYVSLPPGEMFAEEYAACALGLTQIQYQAAGYNSYGWVPPRDVLDSTLCDLIRSAA